MRSRPIGWLPVMAVLAGLLAGCDREQPVEVFLPPEGDALRGRQVFLEQGCQGCHTIPGVELPGAAPVNEAVLALGVRLHRVRNYGELLTAVIYPDHVVSPKYLGAAKAAGAGDNPVAMPDFTETMTVADLLDVVEFLHAQYSELLADQYQGRGTPPLNRLERRRDVN